jgi:hypothetical protein
VSVLVGRGEGHLVDISRTGIRLRHSVQARHGTTVRVSFEWQGARFAATAEVLASRVVSFGDVDHPTLYDSRLRFSGLDDSSAEILDEMTRAIEQGDVQHWIANLHGSATEDETHVSGSRGYLRCRLRGSRWERKWTRDRTQPTDGFVVSDALSTDELDQLCSTYKGLDSDGRQMVRFLAAASIS